MTFEQLGPYQIVRKLGRGGMGVVYEGVDEETGQRAAVKILSTALNDEEDFRQRFEAEIEALRKLKHPNIVRLFGFGQHQGHLFYAMELVDGPSLESELRHGRRFDWREAAQIGIQVCRGLRHAHDRGVIHRDLKPGNLLVASDGTVKLSDFGIAQLFGRARLTSVGSVLGTIEYMAPEQAEARLVDHRADLYSLGGVLYAVLAQRPPLRAQTVPEMLEKLRAARPEPVGRYATDVPADLEQTISQLLERDPDKRIGNARIVSRHLEAMLRALSPETAIGPESESDAGFDLSIAAAKPEAPSPEPHAPLAAEPEDLRDQPSTADQTPVLSPRAEPDRDLESPGSSAAERPRAGEGGKGPGGHFAQTDPMTAPPAMPAMSAPGPPQPAWHEAATVDTLVPQAPEPPERPTHFTLVAEGDLDRAPDDEPRGAWISVQTWILALALAVVGLVAWYLLQPPTADGLYDKIMARTRDGSIESLRAAEANVAEFLTRFSDDSRADEVRDMEREIALDRLERRFELRASGRISGGSPLSPCERAYLEAIQSVRLDPELGMARLQALIDLYGYRADRSGPTGQCLELAQRRLDTLREELGSRVPGQVAMIQDRLNRADELAKSDPAAARAMRQAVIVLYGDKPWAAEAVTRARGALKSAPGQKEPKDKEPKHP